MDAITTKAAKLARRWDRAPSGETDSRVAEVMGDTLWFAQVKLNIAAHNLFRPLRNSARRILRSL